MSGGWKVIEATTMQKCKREFQKRLLIKSSAMLWSVVCGAGRVVYMAREALTAAASASSGTRRDSGRASRGREAATVAMIDHESR
jgi:hypothetical protein